MLIGAYLSILFFPMLYMGRVLSPNDIYYHYEPWSLLRHVEAQNPLIHDPPVSYVTLMSLLKSDPSSFHWNRYVASGIPGFGSTGAAVLSPFILIPTMLLPLSLVYTGIILLKALAGFALAYWWLREERLGKRGAAVGALVLTAAGPYAVWWLWQGTNATVLYPAVLLLISRIFHRKSNSIAISTLVVVALLLSGFPATIAYITWLAAAYFVYLSLRHRFLPLRELAKGGAAMLIGALIAAPFIAPLVSFLRRSGHFALRERAGYDFHYPLDHLRSFLDPFRLGDPTTHLWIGESRLAISNNFIESTVYLGLLTLILVPLGLFARRARNRWFWAAMLLFTAFCMFGEHHPLKEALGGLPGFRFSPLTRLRVLMPLPVAYLVASAMSLLTFRVPRSVFRAAGHFTRNPERGTRNAVAIALGLGIAVDLALFAGHFFPFIEPRLTNLVTTPILQFLREERQPFRIAPFFNYLWPNTAEIVRVEDIRSHFGSEETYRELVRRFDPQSWGGSGTVLRFNGLSANITDPVLALLGVRYLIEQPNIDILKWRVLEHSQLSAAPVGELRLKVGELLSRELFVDSDDLHAIDVNFGAGRVLGRNALIHVELIRPETGKVVFIRNWTAERLSKEPKVYIPISPFARAGNVLLLRARAERMEVLIPTTAQNILYGKVRSPVIPLNELPDGRIFQNVAELPRHWAVWKVRQASLMDPVDFGREAIVSGPPPDALKNLSGIAPWMRRVQMRLLEYSGSRQRLETSSEVPFLLTTSEKLTPELRINIDGRAATPIQVNGLFAAVRVGPGSHRVELTRRIGRGWWPAAFVALAAWIAIGVLEWRRLRTKWVEVSSKGWHPKRNALARGTETE